MSSVVMSSVVMSLCYDQIDANLFLTILLILWLIFMKNYLQIPTTRVEVNIIKAYSSKEIRITLIFISGCSASKPKRLANLLAEE